MIRRILTLLGLVTLAASWSLPATAAIATHDDLQRVCDEFQSLGLDPARAHDVKNLTIVRDIGTLRLAKGVLIFSKKVEGVTPAAVFLGTGSFTLTPVRKMDRQMLDISAADHLHNPTQGMINTDVSEAVLFAYEDTWKELQPSLSAPRAATADELSRGGNILKDQLDVGEKYLPPDGLSGREVGAAQEFNVIAELLGDPWMGKDTLRAEINTSGYGWLSFAWVPSRTHEVRLGTRETVGAFLDYDPLVYTHRKADFDDAGHYVADPVADRKDAIHVDRYRMNLEVPDLQKIDISVDVTFTPKVPDLTLVDFALISDVKGPRWDSHAKYVDAVSVKDADGHDLAFLHRKDRILVIPPAPLEAGKEVTWSFVLSENTITQFSNNHFSLLNTYAWYPQYGYLGGQYSFDWTIKTVKPYTATGSGTALKRWEEGPLNAVHMVFDRPVEFPSLIFGRYQAEEGKMDSAVSGKTIDITAYSWPETTFFLGSQTANITVPRNKPKDVVDEAKEIIKFMEDLYGPFPYDKLDVAMMAPGLGFGQSPPAFVQLTGEAFMSSSEIASFSQGNADFFHGFFSHEVAHQWWGHKIMWIDDEDTWLSESFAEYSAALYVLALQGQQRYQDKIRRWEENAKIADPHASIAWANNTSGTYAGQWRTELLYDKGPYVVHMLRMLIGPDNFKKAMHGLFTKYAYQMVTTDAVQKECEAAAGFSLDFFFDQWFRGTGIPIFDYDWDAQKEADGSWLVTINISQRDKKNFKQVLMPIYFHFKGQKEPMVRARPITTPDHVYKLKLPEKPDSIVLDENHDILGDMYAAEGKH
ncbi:MAG TPA: M1 family aminopeptidase [Candidatus Saccharimonadales bacterium]|nr:M1 family aminopeptidase [Candidatus Saccharimonadales bacterium]